MVRAPAQCSAAPIAPDGEAGAVCHLKCKVHLLLPFIAAYGN